jgi:serine/threonine protein phosphatase PrpC
MTDSDSGTCAEVFMDLKDYLVFAKVGDSISIIVNHDGSHKVVGEHHKGHLPIEKARCEAAGFEIYCSRVNGYLAVSRAIGDKCVKHSYDRAAPEHLHAVTALPTVSVVQKTGQEWFVITASDGIYEGTNTAEDTVKIAYDAMTGGLSEELIAAEIIFDAQSKGSTDNISAVISKITPFIAPAVAEAVAEAGAGAGAGAGA